MKRVVVFVSVASLLVLGFGMGANAQSTRSARSSEVESSPMSRHIRAELDRIGQMGSNITLCRNIGANTPIGQLTNCLNKVTQFAKETQRELTELERFTNKFFDCTSYSPVGVRGTPNGPAGYVFDLGTGTTIKWSALDEADPATEGFTNFYVLKQTDFCIEFSGGGN
jgi:hypothetical protein